MLLSRVDSVKRFRNSLIDICQGPLHLYESDGVTSVGQNVVEECIYTHVIRQGLQHPPLNPGLEVQLVGGTEISKVCFA